MFIKKDLRKIPKILEDAIDCSHIDEDEEEETASNVVTKRVKHTEPLKSLRLARRQHEFQGSVKILCEPSKRSLYIPKLRQLELLNLYDCNISNLDGIGDVFNATNTPNLKMINLGRNPLLSNIPMEFASIQSIQHLWLDDCHALKGQFPKALLELTNLESLRMPNCKINAVDLTAPTTGVGQEQQEEQGTTNSSKSNSGRVHRDDDDDDSDEGSDIEMDMDTGDDARVGQQKEEEERSSSPAASTLSSSSLMVVKPLKHLKILCLDRNELTELPSLLGKWVPNLEELYVRHNNIQSLNNVESFPSKIKIMHFSSNQLEDLNALTTISKQQQQQQQHHQQCPELTHLYVNGNQLKSIPNGILDSQCCPKLERLVVCHNPPLSELPDDLWEHIHSSSHKKENEGDEAQEEEGGSSNKNKKECKVVWEPNPNIVVVPGPTNLY